MCDSELFAPAFSFSSLSVEPYFEDGATASVWQVQREGNMASIGHVGVDLSVVCDDLWYAKMTFGES